MSQWMVYGANGYSARLIVEEALRRDLKPVLAGRNQSKVAAMARETGLEHRVFSLDEPAEVAGNLADMDVVLHCAGPFSATSAPMVEACLASRTHYLDITGEIEVFEQAAARGERAREAGIVLCPGVGFDVIPTDCVASRLKAALPDATSLKLAFDSRSGLSPGTAKTSVEGLAGGGKIRRNGTIETVPLGYKIRSINFGRGPVKAVTIPWGDVSTAWHTTGIPEIEVYMTMPPSQLSKIKFMRLFAPLLRFGFVQNMAKRKIEQTVNGPDEDSRTANPTLVWGRVENTSGEAREALLKTANGYDVTITGSLAVLSHLLKSGEQSGFFTPSRLMGDALVENLPGSGTIEIQSVT